MAFDLSGVTAVVKDTLRAADEYLSHDPQLSTRLSLRAYEICREFDIDVASLDDGKETAPSSDFSETTPIARLDERWARDQADKDPAAAEDQLAHILDLQNNLIDAQTVDATHRPKTESHSDRPSWKIFGASSRPQPI